jgi:hypothetical protein
VATDDLTGINSIAAMKARAKTWISMGVLLFPQKGDISF